MRPDPPIVLRGVAAALMRQVAPEVSSAFGMGTLGNSAGLLGFVAEEFDRAAARLVEENRALVGLFSDALDGGLVPEAGVRTRLTEARAVDVTRDLRVSVLQEANDGLRGLLVELHALVEATPGPAAAAFTERIWEELKESTRRRDLERIRG